MCQVDWTYLVTCLSVSGITAERNLWKNGTSCFFQLIAKNRFRGRRVAYGPEVSSRGGSQGYSEQSSYSTIFFRRHHRYLAESKGSIGTRERYNTWPHSAQVNILLFSFRGPAYCPSDKLHKWFMWTSLNLNLSCSPLLRCTWCVREWLSELRGAERKRYEPWVAVNDEI